MASNLNRILIVDDDEDILANLADILSDAGYEIDTANNGQTALEKVDKKCPQDGCHYDLCLLDFKMPDMDGVELYTRILRSNPEMRAIMITAYAGENGIQRARDAGTWEVLSKPVDIKRLLGIINDAVAG